MNHPKYSASGIRKIGNVFIIALVVILTTGFTAIADVTGTIVDKNGEPVIGASVFDTTSKKGTSADLDGKFVLTGVSTNATLKISAVGYETQTVPLNGRSDILITMQEANNQLDGVVVIGYGSLQKKQVTSSITSISGDDLSKGIGGATVATALQGKIAGLSIDGNNSPNAEASFQLRGVGSINAGQQPLVVIDGVPGGDIRSIAQEDIESIDVLKDASAGAIYGTRAAAGVILITTKTAKAGKTRVTYSGEFSTDFLRDTPILLNRDEYLTSLVPTPTDWGHSTDWYDAVTRNHAFGQQHMITLQGGADNISVYSSLMFKDADGLVIGDSRKDYSARINANYKMFDKRLDIGLRLMAREAHRDSRGGAGTVGWAMRMNPTIPLYSVENPDMWNVSEAGAAAEGGTPVSNIMYCSNDGKDQWVLGTATLRFKIIDGLYLNGSANVDRRQSQWTYYEDFKRFSSIQNNRQGYASHQFSKTNNMSYDAYLSYLKSFGNNLQHRVDVTAGWSYWTGDVEWFSAENADFTANGIGPWNLGEGLYLKDGKAGMSSGKSTRTRLLSFFGRVNYAYDDKYMVSASMRREGSSKFGKNHRWGTFWALSGGWRISKEAFMEPAYGWLNDLKLRVAYGVTGNNDFSSGNTVTRLRNDAGGWYNEAANKWLPSYGPNNNANPDLRWEEKKELNIGIDFSLLDNRLWGKFDWYTRDIDNLLFEVDAPQPPMVSNKIWRNIGSMQNKGWEIEIGGIPVENKNFSWTSTINISHNSGKIKKLGMEGQYMEEVGFPNPGAPGNAVRLSDGTDLGRFFVYRYAGLDQDGNIQIYNKDNEVVPASGNNLNSSNKSYVGNAFPAIIGSWSNTFKYRNFDFGLYLRGWFDFDVYSQPDMYLGIARSSGYNLIKDLYEKNKDIKGDKVLCDYFIHDASFMKIDAITLGYTLPTSQWTKYVDNVRFYLTLRDVARFTSYPGLNPEVEINGLTPGFEYLGGSSIYPQAVHTTLGIQVTF